jgi:hypothetical protein
MKIFASAVRFYPCPPHLAERNWDSSLTCQAGTSKDLSPTVVKRLLIRLGSLRGNATPKVVCHGGTGLRGGTPDISSSV